MHRRDVLQITGVTASGFVATTAGCISISRSTIDTPRIEVTRIETPPDAIRLNKSGSGPIRDIPVLSSLSERKQRVVRAAIEQEYKIEQSDPPRWLVKFFSTTDTIRRENTYYELTDTFPTYTITASQVDAASIDGKIADREAYRNAVTHDGIVETGLLRNAEQGGVTKSILWPSLRSFLDTYAAVRYRGRVLTPVLTVDDDGPPYTVRGEQVSAANLTNESVFNASAAQPAVQRTVRSAGQTTGIYAANISDTLLTAVDTHQYIYLNNTFYWAGLESRNGVPVAFSASVIDQRMATDDGAKLRLTLTNQTDQDLSIYSGAPGPFGVIRLEAVGDATTSVLWTDAYERSNDVKTEHQTVTLTNEIAISTPLSGNESISRVFSTTEELPPGSYVIRDNVGIETPTEDGGALPYRVYLEVTED